MGGGRAVWHPDIAAALGGLAHAQADAAGDALSRLLSDTRRSARCTLTGDGFPLICAFSSIDDTLRWTADLRPAATPAARAAATIAAYRDLTGAPQIEGHGAAYFGAWLGGRVTAQGACRYKLYLEPDHGAEGQGGPLEGLRLGGFRHRLRMIAHGPEPDAREYYYRFDDSTPALLRRLLDVAGLGGRFAQVMDLICTQSRRQVGSCLPGRAIGASYAQTAPGRPAVLTLYFFARSFWGNDAKVRSSFLRLLTAEGRDTAPYAAASASLRGHRGYRNRHDMIALAVSDEGHGWGLGLRPTADLHAQA